MPPHAHPLQPGILLFRAWLEPLALPPLPLSPQSVTASSWGSLTGGDGGILHRKTQTALNALFQWGFRALIQGPADSYGGGGKHWGVTGISKWRPQALSSHTQMGRGILSKGGKWKICLTESPTHSCSCLAIRAPPFTSQESYSYSLFRQVSRTPRRDKLPGITLSWCQSLGLPAPWL